MVSNQTKPIDGATCARMRPRVFVYQEVNVKYSAAKTAIKTQKRQSDVSPPLAAKIQVEIKDIGIYQFKQCVF
jgi:hypothetical protein